MIEQIVIEGARREAEREAPGEPIAAGRAVTRALRALEGGASASEAIFEARRFARGWALQDPHPSARRRHPVAA